MEIIIVQVMVNKMGIKDLRENTILLRV